MNTGRSVAAATLCALVIACGAPTASTTTPIAEPRAEAPEPWRAVWLVDWSTSDLAGVEPDGALAIINQTSRVRVRGTALEWAPVAPMKTILTGRRIGDRWYFLLRDGTVLRSDDFLGPLERVEGSTAVVLQSGWVAQGVLLAADYDRAVWMAGEDGQLRRLPPPADAPLVDAAYVSPQSGLALLEPGRLLRTNDGIHFSAVDTLGHVPVVTWPFGDRFFVELLDGGWLEVGTEGPAREAAGEPPWSEIEAPDEVLQRIDDAIVDAVPWAFAHWQTPPGARGRVLTHAELPTEVWEPGAARHGLEGPEGLSEGCAAYPLGDRVLAVCEWEEWPLYFVSDDARSWRAIGVSRDSLPMRAVDGSSLLATTPCDVEEEPGDETSLCLWDGSEWLPVQTSEEIVAVHGTRVLTRADDGYTIIDARSGGTTVVRARDHDVVLDDAGFTGDGLVWALSLEERPLAGLAPAGMDIPLAPLPAEARYFAMANARHGMAIGAHLGEVWVTEDGAASFSPLALPVDGDPAHAEVSDPLDPAPIQCGPTLCVIHHVLVWGALSVLGPDSDARPRRRLATPPLPGAARQPRQQAVRGPDVRGTLRTAAAPGQLEGVLVGDGWARVSGGDARLEWGGADARGAFRARSAPGFGALPERLTLATRELAIVRDSEGLIVVRRNATPTRLGAAPALAGLGDGFETQLHDAIALPDGGAALRFGLTPPEGRYADHFDFELLLWIARDGSLRGQRTYIWPSRVTYGLLAIDPSGAPALASFSRDTRELVLHPIGLGSEPRAIGRLPLEPMPACASSDPRAIQVVSGFDNAPNLRLGEYEASTVAHVQLDGRGGACVRALTMSEPDEDRTLFEEVAGVPFVRADRGRFVGTVTSPSGARPLACTIEAPAP